MSRVIPGSNREQGWELGGISDSPNLPPDKGRVSFWGQWIKGKVEEHERKKTEAGHSIQSR